MSETYFKELPVPLNDSDEPRTVGFELEFSGLTLEQTSTILCSVVDGECVRESKAEHKVKTSDLGTFNVEIDWAYLKKKAKAEGADESSLLKELGNLAERWVPIEIVCPPLTLAQCKVLTTLVDKLRNAGAKGTDESWIAAYGVHINAEIPKLDAPTVLRYLQAFGLLQWWLIEKHQVDTTRKISPYIDKYPEDYLHRLMTQDEADMSTLIDDYLSFNATRNRALDMLPLFSMVDEDRVMNAVNDGKIKARPTFHYRLPNCQIEHPGWQLSEEWNLWWVIEALASDQNALAYWRNAFLEAERPIMGVAETDWKERLTQWLSDREWW